MSKKRGLVSSSNRLNYSHLSKSKTELTRTVEKLERQKRHLTQLIIILCLFLFIITLVQSASNGTKNIDILDKNYNIKKLFSHNTSENIFLEKLPHSLKLTGNFSGNYAKVYALIEDSKYLILDTDHLNQSYYSNFCLETCNLSISGKNFSLILEIDGDLYVDNLNYEYLLNANNYLPEWKGRSIFIVDNAETFGLDLREYISDFNQDKIKYYLPEKYQNISYIVNDTLFLLPSSNLRGENKISLTFGDGIGSVEKQLSFFVIGDLPDDVGPFIDPNLVDELYRRDSARVIIELNEEDPLIKKQILTKPVKSSILGNAINILAPVFAQNIKSEVKVKESYKNNNLVSADISSEGLKELESNHKVKAVYIDPILSLNLEESVPLINGNAISNMQGDEIKLTGKDQSVCVIDTGVASHNAFGDRIVAQQCFCSVSDLGGGGCCGDATSKAPVASDDSIISHGTKVAGIVASNGDLKGVAPEANIIAIKACDFLGRCLGSDILSAIDYCISKGQKENVVSMVGSFSDGQKYSNDQECPVLFDNTLNKSLSKNIIPVFSSGNEFHRGGVGFPACSPYSVSVGAIDKNNELTSYTNVGENLDILAPGDKIISTSKNNKYSSSSGTSMAAPFVAGAISLLNQVNDLENKNWTSLEIIDSLKQAGKLIGGYPSLDVKNTLHILNGEKGEEYVRPIPKESVNEKIQDISSLDKVTIENGNEIQEILSLNGESVNILRQKNENDIIVDLSDVSFGDTTAKIETVIDQGNYQQNINIFSGELILELEGDSIIEHKLKGNSEQEIKTYIKELNSNQIKVMSALDKLNVNTLYQIDHVYNGLIVEADEKDLEEIKKIKEVKAIHYPVTVTADLTESLDIINAKDVWREQINGVNITGKGMKIAIIDTGVDYTHQDLGGCFGSLCKVVKGYDYVNRDNNPMDDHGHGTHVAATSAGKGILNGVAPDAKIYAYKVLGSGGSGSSSNIVAAINDAVKDGADVISMSLGGSSSPTSPMSVVSNNAMKAGVVVVAAAGNSGPSKESVLSPGNAKDIVTVGATSKTDSIASFSSRGPTSIYDFKPEIVAPGVKICAAQWGTAWENSKCLDDEHTAISGTSMATPHVAGAITLLKQKYPNLSTQELKSVIISTSKDLGYDINTQGAGRLDVANALRANLNVEPAKLSLGRLNSPVETIQINVTNFGNSNLEMNVITSKLSDGIDEYKDIITFSPRTFKLTPGQKQTVSMTLDTTNVSGGVGGIIKVNSNDSQTYSVPIYFARFNEILFQFKNEDGTFFNPSSLIVHDDKVDFYKVENSPISSQKSVFVPKKGTIYYHIMGGYESSDRLLISGNISINSEKTVIEINKKDYKKYTLPARTFDGKLLDLPSFSYNMKIDGQKKDLYISKSYSSYFLHGDQDIILSDDFDYPFKREVEIYFTGIPETKHKNLYKNRELDTYLNNNRYAVSPEIYYVGHSLRNKKDLNFSYDKSEFGTYNYTYNYPREKPYFMHDTTFWNPTQIFSSYTPSRELVAPTNKKRYVQDNGYGMNHYVVISYNQTPGSSKGFYIAQGRTEQYKPNIFWPAGIRGKSGEVKNIYMGGDYSLPYFENTQNYVKLRDYILMDKGELSSLTRKSSVYYSGKTIPLEKPNIKITNEDTGSVIFNGDLTNWKSSTWWTTASKLKVLINIDPKYSIYNTTIESLFKRGENPPSITNFDAPSMFEDIYNLGFNVKNGANIKKVEVEYLDDKSKWKKANNIDLGNYDYEYSIDTSKLSELRLKLTLEVDKDTRTVYDINPISHRGKNLNFNLKTDKTSPVKGDKVTLSGECKYDNGSICEYLGFKYLFRNKEIGQDVSSWTYYEKGKFSYLLNFTKSGTFKLVFPGTGWFNPRTEFIKFGEDIDDEAPIIKDLTQSPSIIYNDDDVITRAVVTDDVELKNVSLYHNASGKWKLQSLTKSGDKYSSIISNSILENQEIVGWQVKAEDTSNNLANSLIQSFKVQNRVPSVQYIPHITVEEKEKVELNVNVSDLDGDEISITYPSPFDKKGKWQTTEGDAGNYSFTLIVSDGIVQVAQYVTINVTKLFVPPPISDKPENKTKPEKPKKHEKPSGELKDIYKENFKKLGLKIGDSTNLSQIFEGRKRIKFSEDDKDVLEFFHEFKEGRLLNLTKIILKKQANNTGRGSLIIKGLSLINETKTIYLDNLNNSVSTICIEDAEINDINDISLICNEKNEYVLDCTNSSLQYGKYTCTDTGSKYKVTGLSYSGAVEVCVDKDGDGSCLPLDCSDTDSTRYPGAIEICGDGIDQDCNGSDLVCNVPGNETNPPENETIPPEISPPSSGGGSSGGGSGGGSSSPKKTVIEIVKDLILPEEDIYESEIKKPQENVMTEYEQRLVDKTIDVCASSYLHRDDPNYLELEEKCISETQIQETKFDIVDLLNSNSTKSVLLAVIGFLFLIILWIYIRDIKD